jgi:hypothetical protein
MTTTRQDIADALSTVTVDWNGSPFQLDGQSVRPPALAVWQAFPDWVAATWLTRCVTERQWSVYVILPAADPDAWASATDAALDVVRSALIKIGSVTRVEPVSLVVADQSTSMPALNFSLITS